MYLSINLSASQPSQGKGVGRSIRTTDRLSRNRSTPQSRADMCALRIWVLQLVAIVENGADVTVGLANGRDQGIGRACIDNEAITVLRQPECRKGSRKEAEEG